MTADVLIRPIRTTDADAFWELLGGVIDEKVYLATTTRPPIESTRAFVAQCATDGSVRMVAEHDGTLIGWCDILARDDTDPTTGVLGMGVSAPWRGKGIGEKLMRATLGAAQKKNFTSIRLDVWTNNAPAIALYEKLGFTRTRTYSKPETPARMLHDMIWQDASV